MISTNRQRQAGGNFEQMLRVALRESVRGEEPSAHIRAALLAAAAASRCPTAQPATTFTEHLDDAQLVSCLREATQLRRESRRVIDALQAQLIGVRVAI